MKPLIHGGRVAQAARELGVPIHEILDFSASINPLGMPEAVLAAARDALQDAVHYPEMEGESLREALAAHYGLPVENLLPGSGSTELLYLLPRVLKPRRALLITPVFSEYERALLQTDTAIDFFPTRPNENFQLDLQRLLRVLHEETDLIMLANPGNPAGTVLDPELIEALIQRIQGRGVVAVDEAFADFCPNCSVLKRVPDHGNLYVFRSLTKFYAIPGLRAGFLAGPARGMARLEAARSPWPLSTPALAAAKACLAQQEYRARTLELIPKLRADLAAGLKSLGLTVFPGGANFLLVRLPAGRLTADTLAKRLRERRILVRECADFPPLDERYLRLAVRTAEENRQLLQALCEVLI